MRFVAYVKSGGRDPQDRMMGVVISDRVAPLAAIDAFYDNLPFWKQRASALKTGELPLADLKPGASLTTRVEGLGSITNKIVDSTHRK